MIPFRVECLANGIELSFSDHSNRYFGDYHRVRVEVLIRVPLPVGHDEPVSAVNSGPILIKKYLERMGVPGAEVDATRKQLAEEYWRHAGPYLAKADCPGKLARNEASRLARSRRRTILRHAY
jgi:hypothetical protein